MEHTENVLLDIRQALLTCEQLRTQTLKFADDKFQEALTALKDRRAAIKEEISNNFMGQKESIIEREEKWKDKQILSQELLKLSSSECSDSELIQNAKTVMSGIATLNEPMKFNELKLIASMDERMKLEDNTYVTHGQMMKSLKDYMQISEYKSIQYKA